MILIETDILKNTDDIYALTGAFFPGEKITITCRQGTPDDMSHPVTKRENSGKGGKLVYKSGIGAMFDVEVCDLSKDELKRTVYRALSNHTGRDLPWGSLTGIRPTRLARKRIELGMPDDQIVADMKNSYYCSDEKIRLSIEIARKEMELINPLIGRKNAHSHYSLYVDVPFCPTRCLYCSFTSNPVGSDRSFVEAYLNALELEIRETAALTKGIYPDTVYIGGGTPTALLPEELERLLGLLERYFGTEKALEYTVEAGRPDSVTAEKLRVLKAHGVTRISVNPQTMNQGTLDLIGRRHTTDNVKEAFHMAREEGFDNINMDIIIGLPGESVEDVEHTVSELVLLDPDSLTVHSLAVKRASVMKEQLENGMTDGADNRPDPVKTGMMMAEMMAVADRGARCLGMKPYYLYRQKNTAGNLENTGYAKEGRYSLYNILINEEVQDILALGAGGISKRLDAAGNASRSANFKEARDYIANIDRVIDKKRGFWL